MTDLPAVVVSARIARAIDRQLSSWRIDVRGLDPELDVALRALHDAGLAWRARRDQLVAGSGGVDARGSEHGRSEHRDGIAVPEAADLLGLGHRAVRKAALEGRLPGSLVDGQWRFDRREVEAYAD